MCGLIYAKNNKGNPVAKTVLKRYNSQIKRGTEGYGYVAIDNGVVTKIERATTEKEMVEILKNEKSSEILFHHRNPSGNSPNLIELTHPFVIEEDIFKSNYIVIVNGSLISTYNLEKEHKEINIEYKSQYSENDLITYTTRNGNEYVKERKESSKFNDSEAFSLELARYLEGKIKDLSNVLGGTAFICIETDKEWNVLNIHYGRNGGRPLVLEENKDLLILKSEGAGYSIDADEIITRCYKTGEVSVQSTRVGYESYAEKNKISNSNNSSKPSPYYPVPHKSTRETLFGNYNKAKKGNFGYNTQEEDDEDEAYNAEEEAVHVDVSDLSNYADNDVAQKLYDELEKEIRSLKVTEGNLELERDDVLKRMKSSKDKSNTVMSSFVEELKELDNDIRDIGGKITAKEYELEEILSYSTTPA